MLTLFKTDLIDLTDDIMVQKYLIHGECALLSSNQYYSLKSEVASYLGVHLSEIIVVGSAKLGFSIAPGKRWRAFGDESDIDIAIVSPLLFDQVWRATYEYANRPGIFWSSKRNFIDYLFRGWIRPDKLPRKGLKWSSSNWFEFFRKLTQTQQYGPYPIKGGIYKDWNFFESYSKSSIAKCRNVPEDPNG